LLAITDKQLIPGMAHNPRKETACKPLT